MFSPTYTRQFERDLKRLRHGEYDLKDLKMVLSMLIGGERLPQKFKNHQLIGAWKGRQECHIRPDWLLIYKIDLKNNLIIFERTGSHSDLFG